MTATLRLLTAADGAALEAFLARHAAFTMLLRANLRASGLQPGSGPYHGVYAARLAGDRITDVAAHYWNGNIILFAPTAAADLAEFLAGHTAQEVAGVLGPWRHCLAALEALGLRERAIDPHEEDLFELPLARLVLPPRLSYRRATARDRDTLVRWRIDYAVETLGLTPDAKLAADAEDTIARLIAAGHLWVATDDAGAPLAMSAFNAVLPDMVQVGGVHTPKPWRGRGYARMAVAGALAEARAGGATTAILFTEVRNAPAQAVYTALGFRRIGDYGLILLRTA